MPVCGRSAAASQAAQGECETSLESVEHDNALSNGARLYTRIAFALHALDGLPKLRADVAALACTPAASYERFKTVVGALLALVFEAADGQDPQISRLLVALFNLMQGKEFAGRERAAGAAFVTGKITREQEQTIETQIEMQEQALRRFESFAEGFRNEWTAMQATLPLADSGKAAPQAADRPRAAAGSRAGRYLVPVLLDPHGWPAPGDPPRAIRAVAVPGQDRRIAEGPGRPAQLFTQEEARDPLAAFSSSLDGEPLPEDSARGRRAAPDALHRRYFAQPIRAPAEPDPERPPCARAWKNASSSNAPRAC